MPNGWNGVITKEVLERIMANPMKESHRWRNAILAVLVEYYLRTKLSALFESCSVPEKMRTALRPYTSDLSTYLATLIAEKIGNVPCP